MRTVAGAWTIAAVVALALAFVPMPPVLQGIYFWVVGLAVIALIARAIRQRRRGAGG